MRHGKKILARDLVETTFETIKRIQLEKFHKASEEDKSAIELNPKIIFHKAIANCKPILALTPIKRGGVTYQVNVKKISFFPCLIVVFKVPVAIPEKRSEFLSIKWMIQAAKDKERTVHFPQKLAYELIDASNNTGRVVKRKQELHKQCEANRAYAHYRWS